MVTWDAEAARRAHAWRLTNAAAAQSRAATREASALAPFVDQGAWSFNRERWKRRVGLARQGSKVQSDIGGSRVPADELFEPGAAIGVGSGSARDEEGVQLSGRRNVVGVEPATRHKRGADVALLRLE